MGIIKGSPEQFLDSKKVITIGNFDGVHIGHQKIFKAVAEKAKKIKGTAVAMTFEPHPVRVLSPERGLKLITSSEDKTKLIFGLK